MILCRSNFQNNLNFSRTLNFRRNLTRRTQNYRSAGIYRSARPYRSARTFCTGKNFRSAGWSFMETLIVIAVVLILTSSVGFMGMGSLEKARVASCKSQIDSFCVALEAFYMDCGFYPTVQQGLEVLYKRNDISESLWAGPYLHKKPPKDPWGNEYEYIFPGIDGNPYGIRSFGQDGMEGGEGKNADITSW